MTPAEKPRPTERMDFDWLLTIRTMRAPMLVERPAIRVSVNAQRSSAFVNILC